MKITSIPWETGMWTYDANQAESVPYEIYQNEEIIDTIYCYNLKAANELAEEIYPDLSICVQERKNDY